MESWIVYVYDQYDKVKEMPSGFIVDYAKEYFALEASRNWEVLKWVFKWDILYFAKVCSFMWKWFYVYREYQWSKEFLCNNFSDNWFDVISGFRPVNDEEFVWKLVWIIRYFT